MLGKDYRKDKAQLAYLGEKSLRGIFKALTHLHSDLEKDLESEIFSLTLWCDF